MAVTAPPDQVPVLNPRTGEVDFHLAPAGEAEVAAVGAALRAAQPDWADAPLEHRIEVMRRWADEMQARAGDLVAADCADTGYTGISRVGAYVTIAGIRDWCDRAPAILSQACRSGRATAAPTVEYASRRRPYPVLGVISPWNAPLMLSLIDAVPALIAGCAVLVKPSEVTPRFVKPLRETIAAVPELAEVLAFVLGDGRTGQRLIEQVDAVCFTGSVATGRRVAEVCARRFIPAFLELGGKDPVIVTQTADLDAAADAVLRGAVYGTGQVCYSIERIYVHADVHDALVERLVQRAERVRLNFPDPLGGEIGPFTLRRQADVVAAHIADAVAQGARVRCGGEVVQLGGGLYMRPTVITGVTHEMTLMRDETFGPVMPVMAYRSDEEAVALANDTYFGLSAAVIAGSGADARRIGERIDAGTVSLQDTFLTHAKGRDVDSNAFKFSGLGGSRSGPSALLRYSRSQVFLLNTAAPEDMLASGGR